MTSSEMKRAEGIIYLWRGASVYAELAEYGGGALSRSITGVAGPRVCVMHCTMLTRN